MTPNTKRLIEAAFPLKQVSLDSVCSNRRGYRPRLQLT